MKGSQLLLSQANKNLARARQNEAKVPFKAVLLPMALKNRVSGKSNTEKDKGCLYEISIAISCLAKQNYENKRCVKEVEEFNKCYYNYMNKKKTLKANQEKGILTPNATSLNHREVNTLFKRFHIQ